MHNELTVEKIVRNRSLDGASRRMSMRSIHPFANRLPQRFGRAVNISNHRSLTKKLVAGGMLLSPADSIPTRPVRSPTVLWSIWRANATVDREHISRPDPVLYTAQ